MAQAYPPTREEFDRMLMGERALRRREALGIKCKSFAEMIGVPPPNFRNWEEQLRKVPDREAEARWEAALQIPPGWLRDLSIETPVLVDPDTLPVIVDLTGKGVLRPNPRKF